MKLRFNDVLVLNFLLLANIAVFTSCSDKDLFDQSAFNEMMKTSFLVSNIDANQTWQTVGSAIANVTVNESVGSYTIKVYDANPIYNSSAIVLATGKIFNGETWTGSIDYPLSCSNLYISRVDSKSCREVSQVAVTNGGSFNLSFDYGTSSNNILRSKVITRSDATGIIPVQAIPYTTDQINNMINSASMMPKDEWDANVYSLHYGTNVNKYYKIVDTFSSPFQSWSSDGTTIIVAGKWIVPTTQAPIETGVHIIIAPGGEVIIPSGYTLALNGSSYITILKGGIVHGGGSINVPNSGNSSYSGGEVTLYNFNNNGSIFYNADGASLTITGTYTGTSSGSTLINWGSVNINTMPSSGNGSNSIIKTGCKFTVTDVYSAVQTYIGDNTSIECGKYFNDNISSVNFGKYAILQSHGVSHIQNTTFTGPTDSYAIFKTEGWQITNPIVATGNLYFDDNSTNDVDVSNTNYQLKTSSIATSVHFVDTNTIPNTVPAGDCTIGYAGGGTGGDTEGEKFSYSYCFEDNYPKAGDYDFNDVVLGVQRSSKGNIVTLAVTLKAVGAFKHLGAAIRLNNIMPSEMSSITTDGGWNASWGALMQEGNVKSKDGYVVIPLFDDAHYVLSGSTNRVFLNTSKTGVSLPEKTLIITINTTSEEVANKINSDDLDVFITNGYEIHTYPFMQNAALSNIASGLETDHYVWAIQVPYDFKYPTEGTVLTSAYLNFAAWAANMNTNINWYETFASDKVY